MDSLQRDISNEGVVSKVNWSAFTENNLFIKSESNSLLEQIKMTTSVENLITIVGWGNIEGGGQSNSTMNSVDALDAGRVSLITKADGTHSSPDDLFFGLQQLDMKPVDQQIEPVVFWVRRQVAAIAIKTIGLQNKMPSQSSQIKCVIRGSSSQLDYNGIPLDDLATYSPTISINGAGELEIKPFRIFATPADGRIMVEIYIDDSMISSVYKDFKQRDFVAINDKITYITIDLSDYVGSTFELAQWDISAITQQF